MESKCYVCDNPAHFFLRQNGYDFNKCSSCGIFFVDPMPTDKELVKVYSPDTNYQSTKLKKDYKNKKNSKFIKIFKELKKLTEPNQKILDVGASDGEFIFYARNYGFDACGVEPNKTTANIAKGNGLNVFNGFLSESNFSKNTFGIIRLGDVLEHSNDPQKLIDECKSYLKHGGLLIISIPNMDSFWAKSTFLLRKMFSIPWSVLEPPHHLLYFSRSNLDLFFARRGFGLIKSWYNIPPTLKYELGNTHLFGRFKRQKNFKNLFHFVSGFFLYTTLYFIDLVLTPLKRKDYSMVCIYKKND